MKNFLRIGTSTIDICNIKSMTFSSYNSKVIVTTDDNKEQGYLVPMNFEIAEFKALSEELASITKEANEFKKLEMQLEIARLNAK